MVVYKQPPTSARSEQEGQQAAALGFQKQTLECSKYHSRSSLGAGGRENFKIETSLLHRTRESQMPNGSTRSVDPKKVSFRFLFYASSDCWRKIACSFRNPFCARSLFPFIDASMLVCYSGGCPVVRPYKGLPTLVGSRRASKRFLSSGSFPQSSFALVTCQLVV
jgi:hypothetical protein